MGGTGGARKVYTSREDCSWRPPALPMFIALALSEIWLLLLTLSLLSLLLLLLLLLSMLAMTLETAVAATTTKVRKPVTEKTLSCFSIHTGAGVTTLYFCFFLFLLPISWSWTLCTNNKTIRNFIHVMSVFKRRRSLCSRTTPHQERTCPPPRPVPRTALA